MPLLRGVELAVWSGICTSVWSAPQAILHKSSGVALKGLFHLQDLSESLILVFMVDCPHAPPFICQECGPAFDNQHWPRWQRIYPETIHLTAVTSSQVREVVFVKDVSVVCRP